MIKKLIKRMAPKNIPKIKNINNVIWVSVKKESAEW